MILYVDERGCIKDIGSTDNDSLIRIEIDDEGNPFTGWSIDRICCYRICEQDGRIVMMTPYTDSRNIEFYDRGGKAHSENSEGIFDVAELAGENSEAAYDLAEMVADLEERVAALEGKEG